MVLSENIEKLVNEAVSTNAIQRITMDERREIAAIAWQLKSEHLNAYCDNCIIKACHMIWNELYCNVHGITDPNEKYTSITNK